MFVVRHPSKLHVANHKPIYPPMMWDNLRAFNHPTNIIQLKSWQNCQDISVC